MSANKIKRKRPGRPRGPREATLVGVRLSRAAIDKLNYLALSTDRTKSAVVERMLLAANLIGLFDGSD